MKQFVYLLLLFLSFSSIAQPGFNLIDDLDYPTNHLRDMVVDNDTIIGLGLAYADISAPQQGLLLVKFDSSGNYISSNLILDSLGEDLTIAKHWGKITKSSKGGYAINAAPLYRNSALFIKVNNALEVEFRKEYLDTINVSNYGYKIIEISDGYLLYGSIQRPNFKDDPFVRKVDKQGNTLWAKYYGDYEKQDGYTGIDKVNDSLFVLVGGRGISQISGVSFIDFINLKGDVVKSWVSEPNPDIGYVRKVMTLPNGDLLTFGQYVVDITSNLIYIVQPALARLDSNFNIKWVKHFGIPYSLVAAQMFWDIERTQDDFFVGAGQSVIDDPNAPDLSTGWLMKFTEYGDFLWSREDTGPYPEDYLNNHYFGGVGVLSSGNIVAGGTARKVNTNYIWLVKVTTDGCMDTILCEPITGIVERAKKEGVEMKVYPNPAKDQVTIDLREKMENVMITIYDFQGKAILDQEIGQANGLTTVPLNDVPPGLYFLEVRSSDGQHGLSKLIVAR
jgi:hypothetical protein